jgi:DNA-binding NarL/FixJ family response regulator
MITIGVVEDDPGVREHLTKLIDQSSGFQCVGAWSCGETAIPALLGAMPDIVLMDVHLPGMSGIECVAALKEKVPDAHVLMLTVYEDSEKIFQALRAGANGYLVKRDIPKKLLPALREILSGGAPMSSHIARRVVSFFQKKPEAQEEHAALSPRETEVLGLLAEGCLYKEIAEKLGIGHETVRTHVQRIYQKLQVRTRTEAVVRFLGQKTPRSGQ